MPPYSGRKEWCCGELECWCPGDKVPNCAEAKAGVGHYYYHYHYYYYYYYYYHYYCHYYYYYYHHYSCPSRSSSFRKVRLALQQGVCRVAGQWRPKCGVVRSGCWARNLTQLN
jgi:hypothetical protein